MRKTWIKLKRGLLEAKHRMALGVRVWLYIYILDRANWEKGKVLDWKDTMAADDLEMPLGTIRDQRRQLEKDGYIVAQQKKHGQEITILKWTNPREYSGKVYNKGAETPEPFEEANGEDSEPVENHDRNNGSGNGVGKGEDKVIEQVNTPTLDSQDKDHKSISGLPKESEDLIRGLAEQHFTKKTKLSPEFLGKAEAGTLWWAPLREMCKLAKWEPAIIQSAMDAALLALQGDGLTISSPKSIIKNYRAEIAQRDQAGTHAEGIDDYMEGKDA